ncbi:MAG TPA: FAD-dependent oxidoreductase [Rhizomicrobium sp.]|jgi:protoporphyrinogen oxidase
MMHGMTNTTPPYTNLYHVINALQLRLTTSVYGFDTGIVTLAERLAERLKVRYETPAERLLYENGRVIGIRLKSGEMIKADYVIVATPIGCAAELMPDELKFAREFLSSFPHTPLPLVFFFLDRPLKADSYAFFGHPLRDTIYNVALNHTRKTPYMVKSGRAIISAWPCYPGAMQMIGESDGVIIRQALDDLDAFFPGIANWVAEARVMRHTWGVARYEIGTHRKILDFKRAAAQVKGLFFVGNDYDGVHMECGIRGARRAANSAMAEAIGSVAANGTI